MLHILAATQESTPSQTVKFLEVLKRFDAIDTVINYENNKKEVSFIFFCICSDSVPKLFANTCLTLTLLQVDF